MTNTPVEETWWKVTTTTGLVLTLPAPLQLIETGKFDKVAEAELPVLEWRQTEPAQVLGSASAIASTSALTGKSYAINMKDAVYIETFTMDSTRYRDALQRLVSKSLSKTSSESGPAASSPSDDPEKPTGRSTGGTNRRFTRH